MLLCPWDSPGKNIGVGCHFLLQCMKVKSESEVAQSCLTLRDPRDCSLPGSSVHRIFQARVLEWGAIAFSTIDARAMNHLNRILPLNSHFIGLLYVANILPLVIVRTISMAIPNLILSFDSYSLSSRMWVIGSLLLPYPWIILDSISWFNLKIDMAILHIGSHGGWAKVVCVTFWSDL